MKSWEAVTDVNTERVGGNKAVRDGFLSENPLLAKEEEQIHTMSFFKLQHHGNMGEKKENKLKCIFW